MRDAPIQLRKLWEAIVIVICWLTLIIYFKVWTQDNFEKKKNKQWEKIHLWSNNNVKTVATHTSICKDLQIKISCLLCPENHVRSYPDHKRFTIATNILHISDEYDALCKVMENKCLLKDIRKLSALHQISVFEAFHSLIIRFVPKHTGFSHGWKWNGGVWRTVQSCGKQVSAKGYPKVIAAPPNICPWDIS
jgi:hypothetical protein